MLEVFTECLTFHFVFLFSQFAVFCKVQLHQILTFFLSIQSLLKSQVAIVLRFPMVGKTIYNLDKNKTKSVYCHNKINQRIRQMSVFAPNANMKSWNNNDSFNCNSYHSKHYASCFVVVMWNTAR